MGNTVFQYRARDKQGRITSGLRKADSQSELEEHLSGKGLVLTEASVVQKQAFALRSVKVKPKHLIAFTYQFVALLSAGVPLMQTLADLQRGTESDDLRLVLVEVEDQVRGGASLSSAFRQFPRVFSDTYVSVVESGEAMGKLDTVLIRLAEHLEWSEETRSHVRSAMIYPALLLLAIAGLIVILFTFLIPRLRLIYSGAGVLLPLPTRIVIAVSDFMIERWPILLAGLLVLLAGYAVMASTPGGRYALDGLKLRLPVFGPLLRKTYAAKFTATLANLLGAGIDVKRALEVVAKVPGNAVIENAIHEANERVVRGESLADALEQTETFQHLVISMIRAGERTGHIDETLATVNRFYDREIPQSVKRLLALIEPTIVVVAGSVVGFIVASALLPIFKLAQAIH